MDVFTDVDLLCDLMEASNKRRVPVYILLDEKNLSYFTEMCSALDIQNSHLSVSTEQNVLQRLKDPECLRCFRSLPVGQHNLRIQPGHIELIEM